ncbi:hypothetical protein [Bradyrhizobium sp. CCBAU 51765]|uniref:hypothetical protein n=1 Tax=Bradyrhizobium sp. CCBAU 51765 TaxID=1325102 RepID=UPI001886BF93|nr:hypothetical protein [Bradyrhizobium sp. CCBAU 51765]
MPVASMRWIIRPARSLTSVIARGRIDRFDLDHAGGVRGVIDIVTHATGQRIRKLPVRLENIEV